MCGKETLTTVVSSTSMKVLSITDTAMIQGFTTGMVGEAAEFVAAFPFSIALRQADGVAHKQAASLQNVHRTTTPQCYSGGAG